MRARVGIAAVVAASAVLLAAAGGAAGLAATGAKHAKAQLAAPAYHAPTENLYVPITPCRIVDTRAGTGTGGTPYTPSQTRTYYVSGTFGFAPQGGLAGGCGIASGAVAIAATFLVVSPDHAGRIQAWPNGKTEPTATTFFYGKQTSSSGNTVTINPSTSYSLKVRNYSSTTDLVIDVTGYYVKPLAAMINPSGDLYAGSSRATGSSRVSAGIYRISFDRDVHNCTLTATAYQSNYYASVDSYTYSASNEVQVEVYNSVGTNVDKYVYVHAVC